MSRTIILSMIASAITSTMVLVVGLNFIAPSRAEAQSTVIQAREFDVVDDSGNTLATLRGIGGDGGLVILDHNGTTRLSIYEWGLALNDEHGVNRSLWGTSTAAHPLDGTTMFALSDSEGNLIARLSERPNGLATLAFRDENGDLIRTDP